MLMNEWIMKHLLVKVENIYFMPQTPFCSFKIDVYDHKILKILLE